MALAYGKKCNYFVGRRRLVAQPGGLTVGLCPASSLNFITQSLYQTSFHSAAVKQSAFPITRFGAFENHYSL